MIAWLLRLVNRSFAPATKIEGATFPTLKQLIDPLSLFSYNPIMHVNKLLSCGGFYLPDHDPPLYPPHTRNVIY